ncbi:LuxR C-terminal-related transcriptional regulator [Mesorhizobium sp. KR1-2]|uniref:LuxR C-terminal-related transcriptional regulator n=1 Tax=Mesorhizobium sp. KR1-2 TaxID=3156609 RepID=UPI0032B4F80F
MSEFPSQEDLSETIGAIYDCALDPGGWEATLDRIRCLTNACNAQLGLFDLVGKRVLLAKSVGVEAHWLERQATYQAEFAMWQRLPQAIPSSPDEPQVRSRDLPPEIVASSPFVVEWCVPQGIVDSMGMVLLHNPTRHAQVGVGRHRSVGLITKREIRLGQLLAPHLRRAVTISNILEAKSLEVDTARQLFDSLEAGVVLTDGRARILQVNVAAEAMLRAGAPVRRAAGVLQTSVAQATIELHAAISLAAGNEPAMGGIGLAVRLTEFGQIPALASVLPLSAGTVRKLLEPRARAAVFISTVDAGADGAEVLGVAFGLTRTETQVLGMLLAGHTLTASAIALGIARTTAKTHLGNIFAKVGVSRQADLVRLASHLSAQIGRPPKDGPRT